MTDHNPQTTEATEVEERAAKAIRDFYGDFPGEWPKYIELARVVLEAAREEGWSPP